jgi:hypothetical protein
VVPCLLIGFEIDLYIIADCGAGKLVACGEDGPPLCNLCRGMVWKGQANWQHRDPVDVLCVDSSTVLSIWWTNMFRHGKMAYHFLRSSSRARINSMMGWIWIEDHELSVSHSWSTRMQIISTFTVSVKLRQHKWILGISKVLNTWGKKERTLMTESSKLVIHSFLKKKKQILH